LPGGVHSAWFPWAQSLLALFSPEFESDDLGSRGRLDLTDRLIKPDVISERVHHGESAVSPPLVRQRIGNLHTAFLDLIVVLVHIVHLDVEFNRTPGGSRIRALHSLLRPLQHHPCAAESDGAEIKLAVFYPTCPSCG